MPRDINILNKTKLKKLILILLVIYNFSIKDIELNYPPSTHTQPFSPQLSFAPVYDHIRRQKIKKQKKEHTIIEEKRGLIGIKTFLSNVMAQESSTEISDSNTQITEIDMTELVKYCPVGLTGNDDISSSSSSPSSTILFTLTFFIFVRSNFVTQCCTMYGS